MPDHDPTHGLQDELTAILANRDLRGARLAEAVGGAVAGRCADPYRAVLQCAAGVDLPETQARATLTAIEQQRADMEARLGRDPGFQVAALSRLHEIEDRLSDPGFRDSAPARTVEADGVAAPEALPEPPEDEEARRGARYDRPLACVALAPDGAVVAGGPSLVPAATRVREAARDVDRARATNDGLRLVLPCTAEAGAVTAAERWRGLLRNITGREWSAGVAASPVPVRDPHLLARLAGEALRAARQAGGDRTIPYRPEKRTHARRAVEPWLRGGLQLGDRETPARIEDLSLGGALLGTTEPLQTGAEVRLAVRDTSARPRTVVVASRIERCVPGPAGAAAPWRTAVVFRSEGEARQRLAGLIADLPAARRGPGPEAR